VNSALTLQSIAGDAGLHRAVARVRADVGAQQLLVDEVRADGLGRRHRARPGGRLGDLRTERVEQ
jgi:hypothetical protein